MQLPRRRLLPWWLALLAFIPLQIWLFLKLRDAWGLWPTVGTFAAVGLLAARASRPRGLLAWLLPGRAERRHRARPLWLGVLALAAAVAWLLPFGPQPWLPLLPAAFGAKALLA